MPIRTYTIEWDNPNEKQWLAPDNVALALHAYCKNTRFVVTESAQHTRAVDLVGLCDCNPFFIGVGTCVRCGGRYHPPSR